MESPNAPSGQRLRWWTEETAVPPAATPRAASPTVTAATDPKWYSAAVRVEVAPPAASLAAESLLAESLPRDLGEELEAEALRRSEEERLRLAEEWVVEGDYRRSTTAAGKRLLYTFFAVALFETAVAAVAQSFMPVALTAVLGVYFAFLYFFVLRQMRALPPLRIGVSRFGVSVAGPNYDAMLRWEQIKNVERKRLGRQPYLVITPTDPHLVQTFNFTRRGERQRRLAGRLRWLARMQGVDQSAVYIPQAVLPDRGDTLMKRIAVAQAGAAPRRSTPLTLRGSL